MMEETHGSLFYPLVAISDPTNSANPLHSSKTMFMLILPTASLVTLKLTDCHVQLYGLYKQAMQDPKFESAVKPGAFNFKVRRIQTTSPSFLLLVPLRPPNQLIAYSKPLPLLPLLPPNLTTYDRTNTSTRPGRRSSPTASPQLRPRRNTSSWSRR